MKVITMPEKKNAGSTVVNETIGATMGPWRRTFLWLPTKVEGRWRWFRTAYVRHTNLVAGVGGIWFDLEYRLNAVPTATEIIESMNKRLAEIAKLPICNSKEVKVMHDINVKIQLEAMDTRQVEEGLCKPYRAHIIGMTFDHHAEADTPQEALVLAAMHWQRNGDTND